MPNVQQIAQEMLAGAEVILPYFAALATTAFLIRYFTNIKDEIFRKLLHMVLVVALMFWPFVFDHWYTAALTALLCIVVFYPVLALLGRIDAFSTFVNERSTGEFKASLTLVLLMYAAVLALCWGWRGERILSVAAISAWGYGDATAALVGKRFGRHHIEGRLVEGRKSLEGSLAMFVVSFVSVLVVLVIRGGMTWPHLLLTALVTALVTTVVELVSHHGNDTVTCPLAATAVLIPLTWLLGG